MYNALRFGVLPIFLLYFFPTQVSAAVSPNESEVNTSLYFESIRNKPNELRIFLQSMPKGGDLHNHLNGAVYAEELIKEAAKQNDCLDPSTGVVSPSNSCSGENQIKNVVSDAKAYDRLIDSLSMRNLRAGGAPADSHFFDTFHRFGNITTYPKMLSAILPNAGREHIDYLELMIVPDRSRSMALTKNVQWTTNFTRLAAKLDQAGMPELIKKDSEDLDELTVYSREQLRCADQGAKLGCNVAVRYQYTPIRNLPPIDVFAQLLESFELANQDARVVGVNMVSQENAPTAIRDYDLHMQMIKFLHERYPKVNVSLHAGEMKLGQVPPDFLRDHIEKAVNIAGAQRIGHGVDIAYEDNSEALLKEMSDKQILVEINLTSNDEILGLKGTEHPLSLYLSHHVPIALSTDDAGVLRTDLTNEYQRAVQSFDLSYEMLKAIDRNSLSYSFLPGASLWKNNAIFVPVDACKDDVIGSDTKSQSCKAFLAGSEKARMQWRLESEFRAFEAQYSTKANK